MKKRRVFLTVENHLITGIYDYQYNLCKYVILEDNFSKMICAYSSIQSDLQDVLSAIKDLISYPTEGRTTNAYIGITDYAVMKFMRCFVSASGRRVKLEEGTFFNDSSDPALKEIFKKVKDVRNRDIAHADKYAQEAVLVLYFSQDEKLQNPIHIESTRVVRAPEGLHKDLPVFKLLTEYVINFVNKKLTEFYERLTIELRSKGAKDFANKSKLPLEEVFVDCVVNGNFVVSEESIQKRMQKSEL